MEQKINIAELLKDCPQGMELYSPIFGDVYLDEIRPHLAVVVRTSDKQKEEFLYDGRFGINGECMLFPSKENRDWRTFQRPFKDGDVVFYNDMIAIFKEWGDETLFRTYVVKYLCNDSSLIDKNAPLFGKSVRKEIRFATEEEKEKLFNAIRNNGYSWNAETKTLKKLIEPRFKVGDRIKHKEGYFSGVVTKINDEFYYIKYDDIDFVIFADIKCQDDWELVSDKFNISNLKPFKSEVLVRNDEHCFWKPATFGFFNGDCFYVLGGNMFKQCIPYEGNEHLMGTTDACSNYFKTW